MQKLLRWIGHVIKMLSHRLTRCVYCTGNYSIVNAWVLNGGSKKRSSGTYTIMLHRSRRAGVLCGMTGEPDKTRAVLRRCRLCKKVKVKVHTLDIAPLRSESPLQKRSGNGACSQGISQFYLQSAHPLVHPQSEWAIPAFAFPAITGTHLPTQEGWKAE